LAETATARWMATDPSEFDFADVGGATSNVGFVRDASLRLLNMSQGCSGMGVAITGGNASTQMRFRVVINCEITPASDALTFVDRQPSISNQTWLNQAADYFVKNGAALFEPVKDSLARISQEIGLDLSGQVTRSVAGLAGSYMGPLLGMYARPQYRQRLPQIELM
jgi:hypothetical protein